MHFHLPKPLHGWREFAGEVGIIVLGVLIALGAEQVVETLSWHHKVAMVRQSLVAELANDRARWDLNLQFSRCALRQSTPLDSWARDGGRGEPPAFAVRAPMILTMHTANWTLAASSQTLDHFPLREQLALAALDQAVAAIDRTHELVALGSDPLARRELREALGNLRTAIDALFFNAAYMKSHFDALGVKPDSSDFAAGFTAPDCGPKPAGH
jgi:hypothetical protein